MHTRIALFNFFWRDWRFLQTCQILSNYWMAWASSREGKSHISPLKLMGTYTGLAVGGTLFIVVRSLLVEFVGLQTAQKYFLNMMRCLFRAPMSFFDGTPIGRILSRVRTITNLTFSSKTRLYSYFDNLDCAANRLCCMHENRHHQTKVNLIGKSITNSMVLQ